MKCLSTTLLCVLSLLSLAPAAASAQIVAAVTSLSGGYAGSIQTQGRDAQIYGVVSQGGGLGSVYKVTPAGAFSTVFSFSDATTGWIPEGTVTLGTDGNYYGVTSFGGGTAVNGVLFKLTPKGVYTVLHVFQGGSDGEGPLAAPIEGIDGALYGTTSGNNGIFSSTVYKYTHSGVFSTIYDFSSTTGFRPTLDEQLLQGTDGNLYAIARTGGTVDDGEIIKLSISGKLLSTYSFAGGVTGGAVPIGTLIQASDGNYYGTTEFGGTSGNGTVYKMDTKGNVTLVHSFAKANGGGYCPLGGLVQGTDGYLYGTTASGGANGLGAIFRTTTGGAFKQLYSFTTVIGSVPVGSLLQHTNGLFYGYANFGGAYTFGAIYSLDMSLGQFVTFVRPVGKAGQTAEILGQGLTGVSSVTFNGVSASSFKVVSDTYMTAVIPSGATTGPMVVTTPTQVLTSNVNFRIR